jgi:hypothetical protein
VKKDSEIMVAYVILIQSVPMVHKEVQEEIQMVLQQFEEVF